MIKEKTTRKTFVKAGCACLIAAASLAILSFGDYVPRTGPAYVPGTYSAKARGMSSDVTVNITVDETSIIDVKLDVSGESDMGIASGNQLISHINAAQSANIDGVTGATITSDAVREALSLALEQAISGDKQ